LIEERKGEVAEFELMRRWGRRSGARMSKDREERLYCGLKQ
jgi:hypothetical protein